jgi:hypothetical protein
VTRKLIGPVDGALNGTCPSLLPAPDSAVVGWPDQKLVRLRVWLITVLPQRRSGRE